MSLIEMSLNGEVVTCAYEEWQVVGDALVARHPGAGVPQIRRIDVAAQPAPVVKEPPAPAITTPKPPAVVDGVSVEGKRRSEEDCAALTALGFTPRDPLFVRGTPVNETGVQNATKARAEFEKLPLAGPGLQALAQQVRSEERRDIVLAPSDFRMMADGSIVTREGETLRLSAEAFADLCVRMGLRNSAYLKEAPSELRAPNVNYWAEAIEGGKHEAPPNGLVLRTRGARKVFAAVSEKYAPCDLDKVAEAIADAAPADARVNVSYDPNQVRGSIEVLFHSNVQPKDYVAGEFFRAGVVITTDDTGGGSISGSAVVWQNLCLNLIVIDRDQKDVFNLRHIGDLRALRNEVRKGFKEALGKIAPFVERWGFASRVDVIQQARDAGAKIPSSGLTIEQYLKGVFWGVVEDKELSPVLRASKEDAVKGLLKAHAKDTSSAVQATPFSRTAVANALTRYAHESVALTDPWGAHELEATAGAIVWGNKPLRWIDPAARA